MISRFAGNRLAAVGAVAVGVLVVVAVLAPWLAPFEPMERAGEVRGAPTWEHPFGTDSAGSDVFSGVIHGARISLTVAGGSVAIAVLLGGAMGLIAGYFGGWVDAVVSRVTDTMFALPEVVLALVILAVLGPSLLNLTLAIGVVYTPIFARVCRGSVLRVKQEPYVEAGRSLGLGHARIMLRHVLPNAAAPLVVQAAVSLAFAVLAEAALSYLGLGGSSDTPSWGTMLQEGTRTTRDLEQQWWVAVFPGIAITLAVFSLTVLGDGVRDALDPRG